MPILIQTLLAFAAWTLVVLLIGVGVRRWTLILSGRAPINSFTPDVPHGTPGYRRAMRAHVNCVENLPVFGAVVLSAMVLGLQSPTLDKLAIAFMACRILQSLVHMLLEETRFAVGLRFGFFLAQIICVFAMICVMLTR